ncbi:MAG: winged helix-turn-helix domain-containing protein, partial [Pseudomonadota bacterium]
MSDAPGQLEINRRRVIEAVRIAGRMARIELAEATALSPATVTALTAELIAEGFLEEASAPPVIGAARRGRPRVQLMLRPGAAHV